MFVKLKKNVFVRLVQKLKYFKNECRKKDAIILALEEQIEILKG